VLFPLSGLCPVTILRQSVPEVRCNSVNISEGGMALSTFDPLIPAEDVRVQARVEITSCQPTSRY
jgi:hypothetical protein